MNNAAGTTAVKVSGALPLAALIGGAMAIAFAPILVRVSEVGPLATAFWRVLLSLPFAWVWMLHERKIRNADRHAPRVPFKLLVISGLFFAGDLGIWHISLKLTSVANSTLLVNMAPIFVTLGAWLMFRQRVTAVFLTGMAVALAGASLLVQASFSLSAAKLAGDGLALLAAVSYAGYILSVKELRNTSSTATIMALSGIFTCIALLPVTLTMEGKWMPASAHGWLVVLGLALICQLGGQSLITYAMAHLPAAFSSVSLLVQPVAAALLAWWLLHEPVGAIQAAGGVAVLAGIYVARRGSG